MKENGTNSAIKTNNLCHAFGEKKVLQDINLQIDGGEIFGLLGPSGAGKPTLIKILTGQLKASAGSVMTLGKNAMELKGMDYRRIGIMMDNFGLYERLSCNDNLKFFAKIYKLSDTIIPKVLERVGLEQAGKTEVMRLSKGMRSRLQLARAIMSEPSLLFLDEPTSGLDPATSERIHQLILEEKAKGTTIFLTTHNMAEAEKLCDHIALLNEGHIIESGCPKEICRKYNHQRKLVLHLQDGKDIVLNHEASAAAVITDYLNSDTLETIHSTEPNLETVFMELTGRGLQ